MSLTMRFGTIIGPSVSIARQAFPPRPAFERIHRIASAGLTGCPRRPDLTRGTPPPRYIAFTISSTIFFASANSIMVLSRKKSSFSMPA